MYVYIKFNTFSLFLLTLSLLLSLHNFTITFFTLLLPCHYNFVVAVAVICNDGHAGLYVYKNVYGIIWIYKYVLSVCSLYTNICVLLYSTIKILNYLVLVM